MYIYNSKEIKQIDKDAAEKGMPAFTLMESAGRGLFEKVIKVIPKSAAIMILAGKGNNGGDAIVLARYLQNHNYQVELVFPLGYPKTNTAISHFNFYKASGYEESEFQFQALKDEEWIVDGLLGVGTQLPLREEVVRLTSWINEQKASVIAIDLPTGLSCDNGLVSHQAVSADLTISLHGSKPSAFLFPSADYYGPIECVDIGLKQTSRLKLVLEEEIKTYLSKRARASHKGTYGTGLLIAGQDDMPGSAALAAIGALRFGIGKLTLSTTRHASTIIGTHAPEATFNYENEEQINLNAFTAIAVGAGRVPSEKLEALVGKVLDSDQPAVLDAGALQKRVYLKREAPLVLTPHPGEFHTMTGYSTTDIQANRMKFALDYATEHQVVLVLKGQYTVLAFPDGTGYINPTGNPSLAKGGSGDTLTGMLLAALASGQEVKPAVIAAVYLHGLCADEWVKTHGEAALTAHDFAKLLPKVLKEFSN